MAEPPKAEAATEKEPSFDIEEDRERPSSELFPRFLYPAQASAGEASLTRTQATSALFVLGAWGLVVAAFVIIGTSAGPTIAREMGFTEIRMVRRDFERTAPVGQAGVDAVHDFERDIGRSIDRLERTAGGHDSEGGELKVVHAKRDLQLRKTPGPRGQPGPSVAAGTPLIVVRREGLWIDVLYQTADDELETGWVELRDLELP